MIHNFQHTNLRILDVIQWGVDRAWLIVPALKAEGLKRHGGSNPSLSAKFERIEVSTSIGLLWPEGQTLLQWMSPFKCVDSQFDSDSLMTALNLNMEK